MGTKAWLKERRRTGSHTGVPRDCLPAAMDDGWLEKESHRGLTEVDLVVVVVVVVVAVLTDRALHTSHLLLGTPTSNNSSLNTSRLLKVFSPYTVVGHRTVHVILVPPAKDSSQTLGPSGREIYPGWWVTGCSYPEYAGCASARPPRSSTTLCEYGGGWGWIGGSGEI